MKFECQKIFCKKEVVGASSSVEPITHEDFTFVLAKQK